MIVIRREQYEVLNRASWVPFEEEMQQHAKKFSPKLCEVLGDQPLRALVLGTIERGRGLGLTCRGPLRLLLELTFLFGSSCDTDPQYPWIGKTLHEPGDELERAEELHKQVVQYQQRVAGRDGIATQQALARFLRFARETPPLQARGFERNLIEEWSRIFPAKVEYVGSPALTALIRNGVELASAASLPAGRPHILVASLLFGFGAGCTTDPLYAWIGQTLRDPRINSPAERGERLEKKAVTWLERVVNNA